MTMLGTIFSSKFAFYTLSMLQSSLPFEMGDFLSFIIDY